jgi:protoheme IX farnesyltransferase
MKATAQPLPHIVAADKSASKGAVSLYADLFKARLTLLVLLTTLFGFYLGSRATVDYLLMLHTILGTALVASSAAALNQLWERRYDARMRRTQDRPLPSGRIQPAAVLRLGIGMAVAGLLYLALAVNLTTAALGATSLLTYLFLYTPLKRVTWLNTAVGAVPGGLPPLMGWAAARGELNLGGWVLFGILALWQIPHFLSIAWLYREDYARAGYKMLPVVDPQGRRTGAQTVLLIALLLPLSLSPFWLHLGGPVYLACAAVLGAAFLHCGIQFARRLSPASARRLFFVSILYLPLLLSVLALDKTQP